MKDEYFEIRITWSDKDSSIRYVKDLDKAYAELTSALQLSEKECWDHYPSYAVIEKCTLSGTLAEIILVAANRRHKGEPLFHWKKTAGWKPYFEDF